MESSSRSKISFRGFGLWLLGIKPMTKKQHLSYSTALVSGMVSSTERLPKTLGRFLPKPR